MNQPPGTIADIHIEILNDDDTPYMFVVETIKSVFGRDESDAHALARSIHNTDRARIGPFDPVVASALVEQATSRARDNGYPLQLRVLELSAGPDEPRRCSFCDRMENDARLLFAGRAAFICDQCLLNGTRELSGSAPGRMIRHVPELLDWHFGGVSEADIASVQRHSSRS